MTDNKPFKINHLSDFIVTEHFNKEEHMGVPFRYTYFTRQEQYVASWDGEKYINCKSNTDGSITVVFNAHHLGIGLLKVRREYFIPDINFADGIRNEVSVEDTCILLVNGESDRLSVDMEVVPPYIYIQEIVDNTDDTSPTKALSANQGRVLNGRITSVATIANNNKTSLNRLDSQIVSLQGNVVTLQSEVTNVKNDVVPKAVAEGIAQVVANAPEDLDTLKEVADYIASDKTNADKIITDISNLKAKDSTHDTDIETLKQKDTQLTNSINANTTNIAKNASDITANTESLAKQAEELETKAPKVGYAPDLKVDFAKELVGRGVAEPQEIGTIRPTGVISIGDGNATIEKVKGMSVVWSQVVNFSKVIGQYDPNLYTFTLSKGLIEVYKRGGTSSLDSVFVFFVHNFIASRKYLIVYNLKRFDGENKDTNIKSSGIYDGVKYHDLICAYGADYRFFSPTENFTSTQMQISQDVTAGVALSYTLRPVIYDLTKMFGAGNEPTTIEEFEARKPLGVTDDYNEGEIISYDGENELKSVGFNAWDEKWEVGNIDSATGEKLYNTNVQRIMSECFIKVLPNAVYIISVPSLTTLWWIIEFDERKEWVNRIYTGGKFTTSSSTAYIQFVEAQDLYGKIYKHDICIHLVHSGYRNGEYQPYEDDILRLPNIKAIKDKDGNELFPYGLLSAGSVQDEITATKAVKRIGKRTFAEGDKEDATVLTDGKNTLYALATPIEVDLPEPLNLTYDAWDFGTEELIAEGKTTPLNADVVYQFNAVDRIRENTAKNQELEAELAELKAQLMQLTQVTNDENSNA